MNFLKPKAAGSLEVENVAAVEDAAAVTVAAAGAAVTVAAAGAAAEAAAKVAVTAVHPPMAPVVEVRHARELEDSECISRSASPSEVNRERNKELQSMFAELQKEQKEQGEQLKREQLTIFVEVKKEQKEQKEQLTRACAPLTRPHPLPTLFPPTSKPLPPSLPLTLSFTLTRRVLQLLEAQAAARPTPAHATMGGGGFTPARSSAGSSAGSEVGGSEWGASGRRRRSRSTIDMLDQRTAPPAPDTPPAPSLTSLASLVAPASSAATVPTTSVPPPDFTSAPSAATADGGPLSSLAI